MDRDSLDNLIDERVRYTVKYAEEHSPFYRDWFRENGIDPNRSGYMRTSFISP